MRLVPLELESKLREQGLWPESPHGARGVYVLALDLLFFLAATVDRSVFFPTVAASLGGWVSFLSGLAIFFFVIVGFRWVRAQLLVAAAQPADRHVHVYRRHSCLSAGGDFVYHALSSCRAVRQLCCDLGNHEPSAKHGGSQPDDRRRNSAPDSTAARMRSSEASTVHALARCGLVATASLCLA